MLQKDSSCILPEPPNLEFFLILFSPFRECIIVKNVPLVFFVQKDKFCYFFLLVWFFFMTFCNNLFLQFLKEDTDGCLRVCRSTNVLQCETTVCGSSTAVLTRLPQAAEAPVSCTLCPGGGALSHPGGTPSAV